MQYREQTIIPMTMMFITMIMVNIMMMNRKMMIIVMVMMAIISHFQRFIYNNNTVGLVKYSRQEHRNGK